tara:strand:- start:1394 stop:1603 length:210 start_codon:yes stop_codon:yes gene_type:complete
MKIKLLIPISKEGRNYNEGDIIEINELNSSKWISKGWGEAVIKKEAKPKKETKELKLKSKETKNEASKD